MKRNIYLDFSYLLVLGMSLGAVLVLGAVVAPVVFHSDRYVVDMFIDHYNMGMIMGEIFRRFAYWAYFLAAYIAFYEAYMYKSGQRDATVFAAAATALFSALMFAAIYVPKILLMQSMGKEATQSDTFANIHVASEIDFKLLAIALLVLFIRRLMLLRID
jgi:hypothetical protein